MVGAIFDPNRNELFSARTGGGAALNGQRIGPSAETEIGRAMCMASLPVKAQQSHPAVQRFLRVLDHARRFMHRLGSAQPVLRGLRTH